MAVSANLRTTLGGSVAVAAVIILIVTGCGTTSGSESSSTSPTRDVTTSTLSATPTTILTSSTTIPTPSTATGPPTTTAVVPDVRSVDLAGLTYRVPCPGRGGVADITPSKGPSPTDDGPVTIDGLDPIYGDLDGDGSDDAIVAVTCVFADGGNAFVASIVAVSAARGTVQQVAPAFEGFDPVLVDGSLVVSRADYLDSDARCCPSSIDYLPVELAGGELRPGGPGTPLTIDAAATPDGLGRLSIGSTYAEAAAALGQPLKVSDDLGTDGECVGVSLEGGPEGLFALGGSGLIRSVEIGNPDIRTADGLGIGSTEDEVSSAFDGRIDATPHVYREGGQYLTYTSPDSPGHQFVFDTEAGQVFYYRIGEQGWANAVEGCA